MDCNLSVDISAAFILCIFSLWLLITQELKAQAIKRRCHNLFISGLHTFLCVFFSPLLLNIATRTDTVHIYFFMFRKLLKSSQTNRKKKRIKLKSQKKGFSAYIIVGGSGLFWQEKLSLHVKCVHFVAICV